MSKILKNEESEKGSNKYLTKQASQRFNYIPTKRAAYKKQEQPNREPAHEYSLDSKPKFESADPVTTLNLY